MGSISRLRRSPRRKTSCFLALAATIAAALATGSCAQPGTEARESRRGAISVKASLAQAAELNARTVAGPSKTTFPAGVTLSGLVYTLTLTNPSSAASPVSGGTSTTGNFAEVVVQSGAWTASVTASSDGVEIATGSRSVTIMADSTSSVSLDLAPPTGGVGSLSVNCDWSSFSAPAASTPRIVITPILPAGADVTALISGASPIAYSGSWAPGLYRVEASLSLGATRQWGDSEIAYVLPGMMTNLNYVVPAEAEKGPPAPPTIEAASGYDPAGSAGSMAYASLSWSSSGATSYSIERRSGADLTELAAASYAPIATSLPASTSGYVDSGGLDVTTIRYFQYRVTATNDMDSSSSEVTVDTYRSLRIQSTVGGSLLLKLVTTNPQMVKLGSHNLIQIIGSASFAHWDVAPGSQATVDGGASTTNANADAQVFGDAVIVAH